MSSAPANLLLRPSSFTVFSSSSASISLLLLLYYKLWFWFKYAYYLYTLRLTDAWIIYFAESLVSVALFSSRHPSSSQTISSQHSIFKAKKVYCRDDKFDKNSKH
jgi:hypothetical protein